MMLSEAFGLSDHDRVPTEIASRFDTPAKADAYAADIIEWCRWAALPPAERGEAAREWWCASQGDHADAARAYLAALPAEQRAAMEAQWLDGLPAYAGNCLWLAWRWHSESEAPVRPSLLVATAAVLAVVTRKWDDKGRPVPGSAIREILDLPSYDNLPAFLAAARLNAEANRRGEPLSDAKLGELADVTGMTVRKWRPDFDRFANSAPDYFFPLGLEGLPDAPAMSWEEIRAECAAVEEAFNAARQDRAKSGERRKRQTRGLKVEPRKALFRVAVQLARHDLSVPTTFLRALAAALGMTSASTGRPLIAPDVLKGLGVPRNIKSMSLFRDAARRDGEALRDHVMAMTLNVKSAFAQALEGKAEALEKEAEALQKEGKASEKATASKEAAERIRDHLTATETLRDHLTTLKLDDGSSFARAWENAAIDPKERDEKIKALRKEATKALREWFFARVHHVLQNGYLTDSRATLQPLTLARDIGMDDNGRNTVRDDWRPLSEYRRLVHTAATAAIMTEAIWRAAPKQ